MKKKVKLYSYSIETFKSIKKKTAQFPYQLTNNNQIGIYQNENHYITQRVK